MTRIRSVLVIALGVIAGALCLLALPHLGIAHAQAVAAPAEGTPAAITHDWAFWAAAVLAALAGLRAIVRSALDFFVWLAPKTTTTLDDKARDDLQLVHNKLDALAAIVGSIVPSTVTVNVPGPAARDPQAGHARGAVLLALSFLGLLGIAVAGSGCAAGGTARVAGAAGLVAALDCEAAHIDPQALADSKAFAAAKVQAWLAGTGHADATAIKTDLAPIKSDLGRCAIAGALAAATAVLTSTPGTAVQGLAASGSGDARATFAVAARQLGWPAVKVGGEVL